MQFTYLNTGLLTKEMFVIYFQRNVPVFVLAISLTGALACARQDTRVSAPTDDGQSAAQEHRLVHASAVDVESLIGNGRNLMRSPEGTLVGVFLGGDERGKKLLFTASVNDGKTWQTHTANLEDIQPTSPAIDSNYHGAYIAFVAVRDGERAGQLLYVPEPRAETVTMKNIGPLTPQGLDVKHSFVAASRDGWGGASTKARSVAYGWVDARSGDFYVGVSADGKTFPAARVIHSDPRTETGPSVSIRDDYVFMLYQSRNPKLMPAGVESIRAATGGAHHVWMESLDGGKTWSEPKPLFASVESFPQVRAVRVDERGIQHEGFAVAAGGSAGIRDFSQTLAWAPAADGIMFVTTAHTPVSLQSTAFAERYWSDPSNRVGVVSFKDFSGGDQWTHVTANRPLLRDEQTGRAQQSRAMLHQYSALPLTPLRAVISLEFVSDAQGREHGRITVAYSTDTGKTFQHLIDFDDRKLQALGLPKLASDAVIEVSQCLFAERDGDVYIDVFIFKGTDSAPLYHAKLPLGVNLNDVKDTGAEAPRG
jgi:hypothetical protein